MNPSTKKEAESIFKLILKNLNPKTKAEVVICPPFLYLESLKKLSKKVSLGGQDTFWEEKGAFTGEISTDMLLNIGAKYVILGHSERRALGESNEDINKKIKQSISAGLIPILCVGESIRDENHEYLNFVTTQIEECLAGVSRNLISKIIVAYEPVWAIGKNATREATPEEFREMSIFIKKILNDKFGTKMIEQTRIIYGGSVHPENALGFLQEGADGFLVGRDSLDPNKFTEIISITAKSIF